MRTIDLRIDVTAAVDFDIPIEMAVSVHFPDTVPERPIVVFACPGGGYGRGYFDMRFDGHAGYSQAEHHAARGIVLVAIDHLGVGDSTIADLAAIQFEHLAACHDACCRAVLARLADGSVDLAVAPLEAGVVLGIGQSLGGCVSILTQGQHATFDGVGVLGYSALHTTLPQRDAADIATNRAVYADVRRGDVLPPTDTFAQVDYLYPFHWEDVPADILAADMDGGYPVRRTTPAFGSMTIPYCAVQAMTAGVVAREAASIEVPVMVAMGARDVCPYPYAEPTAYTGSPSVALLIVPTMAHMHNFASTRGILWDQLVYWYDATLAWKLALA